VGVFVEDPEWYLGELGIGMPCAVVKGGTARLDRRYRVRVNHEIYFVSTPAAKRKLLAEPWKYCGTVTDPVSAERFRPTAKSPRQELDGRPYFFASDSTRAAFAAEPATYAEPRSRMAPAEMDSAKAPGS
jgi:YHS domain-containing protein